MLQRIMIKNINAELNCLYKREFSKSIPEVGFKGGYENIIHGGILFPEHYGKKKRLVVILKEGWRYKKTDKWSYQKEGREGVEELYSTGKCKYWRMYHSIARWSYLVVVAGSLRKYQRVKAFDSFSSTDKVKSLRCVGITNVKKDYGSPNSRNSEIHAWGKYTGHILMEELKIMEPDVVICAGKGVYDALFKNEVFKPLEEKVVPGTRFHYTLCNVGNSRTKFIELYPHPSQGEQQPSYNALVQLKRCHFI